VAEKVLGTGGRVQLIVFFAAIREILKREIYSGDKQNFARYENKRRVPALRWLPMESCEFGRFGL
jgi:hypothetical protein